MHKCLSYIYGNSLGPMAPFGFLIYNRVYLPRVDQIPSPSGFRAKSGVVRGLEKLVFIFFEQMSYLYIFEHPRDTGQGHSEKIN